MPAKKARDPKPVIALKHKDKRANIPTKELRDFVAEDEAKPKTILYPRDPSLDPQLVWKGKDEQDRQPLEVPAVPIYIQEKIQPQAIIENVRSEAKKDVPQQAEIFADFNGIKFEDLVDFYHHEQNWTNRFILGDSLLVMTSLAEKEGLKGKVQCLYFDPPYGINFGSNWQVSTRKRDVKDGKAEDATRQPEQIRAFRDTWKLGIHSYLAYLRDRLTAARELLTESGSVFVQIGDENVHIVRNVLDEVFGSENFVTQISFQKTGGLESKLLSSTVDYVLWYAKAKVSAKYRPLYQPRAAGNTSLDRYDMLMLADGKMRRATQEEIQTGALPDGAKRYQLFPLYSDGASSEPQEFEFQGKKYFPRSDTHWKTPPVPGLTRLAFANRIEVMGTVIRYRRFADDFPVLPVGDRWESMQIGVQRVYVVQTATSVIERCVLMTTDPGDLVLDPTCGSGTTAYVAEQWGRRWITIDTSRVAIALARTRLMAAKYPYYLLADSPEGQRKELEASGKIPVAAVSDRRGEGANKTDRRSETAATESDIKRGFVCKRVPHVTLKSIANNPDIKEGMSREEIDKAIARHADTELLYDQPYEDNKRIRVTGPFTVESLSPHRTLECGGLTPPCRSGGSTPDGESSLADESCVKPQHSKDASEFVNLIIENLKKAGVQNTVKNERLKFDRLESFAGTWLHATGEYTESGKSKRVAISIGPEHGTVGPEQVKEAAKEAVNGVGFDLLVVCGFAFDPHVSEEAKRYGKLPVLCARMNPDLSMGDELLKKTGAGNLFMVFGEPDLDVAKTKDGKLVVKINGLDVYDPTTGQIRNSAIADIACWFIDTNYNGESFFVRHAYFTGAAKDGDGPYDKLKRALRAEIDEAAWQTLYATVSRPFAPPATGKIAVKVINHYGDEVLKVCEVPQAKSR